MSEIVVETTAHEVVIDIEGGPTLTTVVNQELQTLIETPASPVVIDLNSGARGEPGSAIITGLSYPSPDIGTVGDIYIILGDEDPEFLGTVLQKGALGWLVRGSIRGPVGGINSVNGYITPDVALTKADIGLGNADNTSDVNKPISTAAQTALDDIIADVDDLESTRALDSAVVHDTGDETIAGIKTFSTAPVVPDDSWVIAKTAGLQTILDATVRLTGAQTIAGIKTFSSAPAVPDSSFIIAKVTGLQAALDSKEGTLAAGIAAQYYRGDKTWQTLNPTAVGLSNVANLAQVATTTAQTIGGTKTFSDSPLVPTPTADGHAANKLYIDTAINALVSSAPGLLDTLDELAQALGDDPNFAATVTASIATKEPIINAGTTGQYWRGDKSWQTLDKTAVGLSLINNVAQVEIAGTQTITGAKTFSALITASAGVTVTGTVTATLFSGSGASLTTLNGTNISSGTVADARLSSNVVLLTGTQTLTGAKTFSALITGSAGATITGTITGTAFAGNGALITALNGSEVTTGTVAAARLPSSVVHRVVHNTTAGTARPSGVTYVEWVGSVAPTNATANDTWVNTAV